jgi:alginate O-acetyltransferase complex protein AlgI
MDLTQITVFALGAAVYTLALPARWRGWALLLGSVIAIYWLQPVLNIRWLDYLLPTLTLALAILSWQVTRAPGAEHNRQDWLTLGVVLMLMLAFTAGRYIDLPLELTARPPPTATVMIGLAVFGAVSIGIQRGKPHYLLWTLLAILVVIFIIDKTDPLATGVSAFLRGSVGQDVTLASPVDIGWLGFSYVAFRLIHTVRDRQSGRLPDLSLGEYLTFVIFFPAYTAGPIDRAERFHKDWAALDDLPRYDADRIAQGARRITIGLFKKFVLSDSLAVFSLSAVTVTQAQDTAGLWILLYAYAFRLYLDFAGYSDIAIGIGKLYGIDLPENFKNPYGKSNIAAFWQSWHITLSNWVRFYVYTPLSRALIKRKVPQTRVILAASLSTMLIIGLWHGVTLPFAIWGAWHGVGLFIHRQWSDRTRRWYRGLQARPARLWSVVGVLLTFHFVTLGWVWFALPDASLAAQTFGRLFGIGW